MVSGVALGMSSQWGRALRATAGRPSKQLGVEGRIELVGVGLLGGFLYGSSATGLNIILFTFLTLYFATDIHVAALTSLAVCLAARSMSGSLTPSLYQQATLPGTLGALVVRVVAYDLPFESASWQGCMVGLPGAVICSQLGVRALELTDTQMARVLMTVAVLISMQPLLFCLCSSDLTFRFYRGLCRVRPEQQQYDVCCALSGYTNGSVCGLVEFGWHYACRCHLTGKNKPVWNYHPLHSATLT